MLAAPPSELSLDVDDLSNVLGVMIEMVRHVGDRTLGAKLYDVETPLADDGLLRRINLSEYYPIVDQGDFNKLFKYHYDLCQNLAVVQPYLDDVAAVRDLLRMLKGSRTRVVLYNQTAAEHGTEEPGAFAEDASALFAVANPARVVYLTRQVDPAGLPALANRVAQLFNKTGLAPRLVLPILVSPTGLPPTISLPWVGPTSLTGAGAQSSPGLIALPPMAAVNEGAGQPQRPPDGGLNIATDLWNDAAPPRLEPFLLLAAALTLDVETDPALGRITRPLPETTARNIEKALGVKVSADMPVSTFLRRAWLNPEGQLLPLVVISTWVNVATAAVRSSTAVPAGRFYNWVAGQYADSASRTLFAQAFGSLAIDEPHLAGQLVVVEAEAPKEVNESAGANHPLTAAVAVGPFGPSNSRVRVPEFPFLRSLAEALKPSSLNR
jgi:hypothetical protein